MELGLLLQPDDGIDPSPGRPRSRSERLAAHLFGDVELEQLQDARADVRYGDQAVAKRRGRGQQPVFSSSRSRHQRQAQDLAATQTGAGGSQHQHGVDAQVHLGKHLAEQSIVPPDRRPHLRQRPFRRPDVAQRGVGDHGLPVRVGELDERNVAGRDDLRRAGYQGVRVGTVAVDALWIGQVQLVTYYCLVHPSQPVGQRQGPKAPTFDAHSFSDSGGGPDVAAVGVSGDPGTKAPQLELLAHRSWDSSEVKVAVVGLDVGHPSNVGAAGAGDCVRRRVGVALLLGLSSMSSGPVPGPDCHQGRSQIGFGTDRPERQRGHRPLFRQTGQVGGIARDDLLPADHRHADYHDFPGPG
jgi:hypothetical protein